MRTMNTEVQDTVDENKDHLLNLKSSGEASMVGPTSSETEITRDGLDIKNS